MSTEAEGQSCIGGVESAMESECLAGATDPKDGKGVGFINIFYLTRTIWFSLAFYASKILFLLFKMLQMIQCN